MFSESEIAVINESTEVQEIVEKLKKSFLEQEAKYFEISSHDFLSLIMMSTAVGKAMANNNISFGEEMSLQKKARKLSKGGFFLSKDPVADGMKYLIKNFPNWEQKFYQAIYDIFDVLFTKEEILIANNEALSYEQRIMKAPYLMVRFLSSLFLEREEDILSPGKIRKIEFDKISVIGEKIGFSKLHMFEEFLQRYEIK
ncbi:MAG: hypothetical protein ACJAT1_002375 [Marivirga sp.]|jgi:hypothetical protein